MTDESQMDTPLDQGGGGGGLLQSLPYDVVMRAKLMVSHLLLPRGSIVLDMECGSGTLTAAMAALQPRLHFIGIDHNRQMIMRARGRFKGYDLPNLTFEVGDATTQRRPDESVDAIVCSRVFGEVYTRSNYDDGKLQAMLHSHMRMLKNDGVLLIHDFPMPDPDEFVQIEFPVPERSNRFFRLYGTPIGITQGEREIELLQWFAQNARARDAVKGFWLEEIPAHVPYTRCFRLPAKWAYEFIIRKTNPRKFKTRIGHQYTSMTEGDFDRILGRELGARIVYSAPWRSQHIIRSHFEGSFRLYTPDGKPRGYFPTGYVVVAQKVASGQTLRVSELKPAAEPARSLSVQAVLDEEAGSLIDVVARDIPSADIIPWFIGSDGQMNVVLRGVVERGLANIIPRLRHNLDGKRWSGHMVGPITLPFAELEGFDRTSHAAVARLMQKQFGLRVIGGQGFIEGPKGFPAPSMIDERLETLFVQIEKPDFNTLRIAGPQDTLKLRVYNADDVLRATGSGFIPNAWLDIQMQELLNRNGLKVTPWLHESIPLSYDPPPHDQLLRAGKILKQKPPKDTPVEKDPLYLGRASGRNTPWPKNLGKFKPIRGRAGQITTMRSSFVEQGRMDGGLRGLSSHDMDFACPKEDMMNIAAVMPLTEDFQGNTLVGFEFKELPVPSRFGQEQAMMNLPTLPLPVDITDIDAARAYIADQFGVETNRVATMGESFFTMIDMMPQRVFPFALTRYPRRRNMKIKYTTLNDILDITDTDFADSILWKWGLSNAFLCHESGQSQSWMPRQDAKSRQAPASPKMSSVFWTKPADNTTKTPKPTHRRHEHR